MICKLNFWLMLQPQIQILELSNTSPERSQSDLCLVWLWRGEGSVRGGSPCPGIALLAWNALGNVQREVWLVRRGNVWIYLCVCVCVSVLIRRLQNLCWEWARTDRPWCGQQVDSQTVWGSQSCLCPVCTLLLWLLPHVCVHVCVCSFATPSLCSCLCETRSTSSTSGQQSTDRRLIRPHALQVDLWTSAHFWPKWAERPC